MAKKMIKIAVIYFMIGIALGLFMSFTHDFALKSLHVHFNLLGWMTFGLVGLLYLHFPHLENTKLAKTHFWLHNIGLPWMMLAIGWAILGGPGVLFPIATLGGAVTLIGVFSFCFNVLMNLNKKSE